MYPDSGLLKVVCMEYSAIQWSTIRMQQPQIEARGLMKHAHIRCHRDQMSHAYHPFLQLQMCKQNVIPNNFQYSIK